MYFSRSIIASTLLGLAVATDHLPEAAAHSTTTSTTTVEHTVVAESAPPAHTIVANIHLSTSAVVAAVHHSTSEVVAAAHPSTSEVVAAAHPSTSEVVAAVHHSTSEVAAAAHTSVVVDIKIHTSVVANVHASSSVDVAAAHPTGAAVEGTVNTHVIQVGGANGSFIFSPETITANAGDLVQFQFNQKNHSVVQSTFDQPCIPIQNVLANKTDAFFSGFMPTNRTFGQVDKAGLLTYTIRVVDTKPIWFYCSQGRHCQAGMVGAINPPATGNRTIAEYKNLASAAVENLSPGQAPGSGVLPPAASSVAPGQPGGLGATGTAASATGSSADIPAQQTVNASPGRLSDSFLGVGLAGLAAFMVL